MSYGTPSTSTMTSGKIYSQTSSTPLSGGNLTSYSPNDYYSLSPNMYSKEDLKVLRKKRDRLENEVALLMQKLETLKQEAERIRASRATEGDLTVMRAETREQMSQTYSQQIGDSMSELSDELRDCKAAKAMCAVFERQLKEAEVLKKYRSDEAKAIENLFNFDDMGIIEMPMECQSIDLNGDEMEVDGLALRLKKIKRELGEMNARTVLTTPERDAALSVGKVQDMQLKVYFENPRLLRVDVHHLEKVLKDQTATLRKVNEDVQYEARKLSIVEGEGQQMESDAQAQIMARKLIYEKEAEQLDEEMEGLKKRIDQEADMFETIKSEIEKLIADEQDRRGRLAEIQEAQEVESETESEESEVKVEVKRQVTQAEANLIIQRNALQFEVKEAENRLKEERSRLLHREEKLKNAIKALYQRYSVRKRQLIEEYQTMDSSSSKLDGAIGELIGKIDGSINELKGGLSE